MFHSSISILTEQQRAEYHAIVAGVLDEFLAAFNSGDPSRCAALIHYPHVRFASGNVFQIWNTPEEFAADNDPIIMKEKTGWAYTTWDLIEILQADANKIHTLILLSRYNNKHERISRPKPLYIFTHVEGRWALQFRSGFMGIAGGNAAF